MIRAQAVIDRGALAHNLSRVRALAPNRRVYAAVKADGYGHGAATVAGALAEADGFAVSSLDEALQLRWAGIDKPVAMLSQQLDEFVCAQAGEYGLELVIFHHSQLAALEQYLGPTLKAWVKIDSGMHRLGFAPSDVDEVEARLAKLERVEVVGWLTHLACADEPSRPETQAQLDVFARTSANRSGLRSIANSAGVLAWPEAHADVVRPGIMLYGSSPMCDRDAASYDLRPAMHLSAPLIARNRIAAGETVGYGATWRTPEAMDVGVIGIGYGDGYPRHAPSGTPVLIDGVRVPLVGRVSMDMITVDLRNAPNARVGDRATLWGGGLDVDEVARHADTIAYELFCRLTPRVRFEVV
ncbi:alanine racemase [Salinisphaera sp.]|uniref:alanine racemase n=1 Tax=Salinisphaera sp. TaxID=1914330 RepID=UPI000C5A3681|nr:alanine racemase [Salinisphaera sp.]MBS63887.1 alanine racemase [Salinisphaera sp.]